jgi:hypothetical protein
MGPKSNLNKVGGVFCPTKINMHQLNTLFYHSSSTRFFQSSPPNAYLVSVKQDRQQNRIGHTRYCTVVTVCSVTIRHAPSGKLKQNATL